MRSVLLSFIALIGLVQAVPAHAQSRDLENRVRMLEDRLSDQEMQLNDLYDRVDRMDRRGRGRPGRPPESRVAVHNCMIVANAYKKTYVGSGGTRLDAEFSAKQSCEKELHPSNCVVAAKCDSTLDNRSSGAVCVIVANAYGRSYRGEGNTPIAAEASAKMSCQNELHASNCGDAPARCELK